MHYDPAGNLVAQLATYSNGEDAKLVYELGSKDLQCIELQRNDGSTVYVSYSSPCQPEHEKYSAEMKRFFEGLIHPGH